MNKLCSEGPGPTPLRPIPPIKKDLAVYLADFSVPPYPQGSCQE